MLSSSPVSQTRYADLTNGAYLEVMRSCWRSSVDVLNISNAETAGDLVEAILGWYYILTVRRRTRFDVLVDDFIVMLERACLGVYIKNVIHG